jgi:hypothetical protein
MANRGLPVLPSVSMQVSPQSVAMVSAKAMNNVMMVIRVILTLVLISVLPLAEQDLHVESRHLIPMDQFLSRRLSLVLALNRVGQ